MLSGGTVQLYAHQSNGEWKIKSVFLFGNSQGAFDI
ncbi:hypothetical protein ABIB94_009222 [Bradyrhizobium sp. JR7.2]